MNSLTCLALALYFEARGEPLQGQVAVGQVIMNRVNSPKYPNDVCKVVVQRHQFSFYWDGKPEHTNDKKAWEDSLLLSSFLINSGDYVQDYSNGALHYAHKDIDKHWMVGLEYTLIGNHKFYF